MLHDVLSIIVAAVFKKIFSFLIFNSQISQVKWCWMIRSIFPVTHSEDPMLLEVSPYNYCHNYMDHSLLSYKDFLQLIIYTIPIQFHLFL